MVDVEREVTRELEHVVVVTLGVVSAFSRFARLSASDLLVSIRSCNHAPPWSMPG